MELFLYYNEDKAAWYLATELGSDSAMMWISSTETLPENINNIVDNGGTSSTTGLRGAWNVADGLSDRSLASPVRDANTRIVVIQRD